MNEKLELVDFSECSFINDVLRFYTYYDFCDNRKILKANFNKLSLNGKLFYKYYVYSNIHMDLQFKNAIWDFLNGFDNGSILLDKKKFYRAK